MCVITVYLFLENTAYVFFHCVFTVVYVNLKNTEYVFFHVRYHSILLSQYTYSWKILNTWYLVCVFPLCYHSILILGR